MRARVRIKRGGIKISNFHFRFLKLLTNLRQEIRSDQFWLRRIPPREWHGKGSSIQFFCCCFWSCNRPSFIPSPTQTPQTAAVDPSHCGSETVAVEPLWQRMFRGMVDTKLLFYFNQRTFFAEILILFLHRVKCPSAKSCEDLKYILYKVYIIYMKYIFPSRPHPTGRFRRSYSPPTLRSPPFSPTSSPSTPTAAPPPERFFPPFTPPFDSPPTGIPRKVPYRVFSWHPHRN